MAAFVSTLRSAARGSLLVEAGGGTCDGSVLGAEVELDVAGLLDLAAIDAAADVVVVLVASPVAEPHALTSAPATSTDPHPGTDMSPPRAPMRSLWT
ncbi:hypothetical protein [Arsenicicoccus bolidensis]|uniref:Uncharacterized protein n=1 Tax=Arsenicicoccus bolidensis TaxID=229480 RepID=A0ABS9Q190_9MICO|nr:hypothetical protein [Arsenicicoccus bolidensis]MCG7320863.1 hypothetical protein [Arsenicicoccus bolidensis]